MCKILHMRMTSLAVAVVPHTGRISQNHRLFERGQKFLQNGIPNFAFTLSQLLVI